MKNLNDWVWRKANEDAEREYRWKRDPYEFAQRHLWIPRFESMSTPALYAFTKDIYHG